MQLCVCVGIFGCLSWSAMTSARSAHQLVKRKLDCLQTVLCLNWINRCLSKCDTPLLSNLQVIGRGFSEDNTRPAVMFVHVYRYIAIAGTQKV